MQAEGKEQPKENSMSKRRESGMLKVAHFYESQIPTQYGCLVVLILGVSTTLVLSSPAIGIAILKIGR
jgi:hypothetical protein